ncbi:MAG TPA: aminoglycoside phosphotransferase family protein [Longimicrobiaceae bacterium]|nr:aminoglycoside phosphotransferase family protein [Longimicrobiaceae bacterium]
MMVEAIARSDLGSFPRELVGSLLAHVAKETDATEPRDVVFRGQHSNDLVEIRYADGRALMVKRGRYDWVATRFETSRVASELMRNRARITAPEPLPLPHGLDAQPLEAYWRIPLPTLQEVWPQLPAKARAEVLRSWGELIRRVHVVKLSGHGALLGAQREPLRLTDFLEGDLAGRLRPAVIDIWPAALGILDRLIAAIPEVAARVRESEGTLIHNDLHMGNVLCRVEGDRARCVGLLDLEAALAGPPEADLANANVMHGPLFAQPLGGPWFEQLREGYGVEIDPVVFAFFRTFHLLNLGFYSALVGHHEHAHEVADAASCAVMAMEASRTGVRVAV